MLANANLTFGQVAAINAEITRLNAVIAEYQAAISALEAELRMNYFHKIYPDLDFDFSGQLQSS